MTCVTLTLRQERWAVKEDEEIDRRRCGDTRSRSARAVRWGGGRDRLARFADEAGRGLSSKQHHRPALGQAARHRGRAAIFHPGDVLGVDLGDVHHMSFCQGLRWFSAKPSADGLRRDRPSWSVSLTIAPANSSSVQRARPSGGLETGRWRQAGLLRCRSAYDRRLARGSSFKAASRLPSTKRRLVLANGRAADSHSSGNIVVATSPLSAANRIWARLILRA